MSTNFTPLPSTKNHKKGATDTNMVLIVIALVITILLGAFMWYLVVQKQRAEDIATLQSKQRAIEAEKRQAELDNLPLATPPANIQVTPIKTKATVTPVASPSATITP